MKYCDAEVGLKKDSGPTLRAYSGCHIPTNCDQEIRDGRQTINICDLHDTKETLFHHNTKWLEL